LGVADEIATLTRVTMDGIISFEESLRLRCVILSQVSVERVHSIISEIPLDTNIERFIVNRRDRCFVVTGNLDIWIEQISRRLGCRGFSSTATLESGRIRLSHVLDKGVAVTAIRALGFDRIVAVGDGANDVPMFRSADVCIAYGGVHSPTASAIGEANYIVHDGVTLCSLLNAL
jgi:HAD superfamily phosphoserine phosphatase-like hydrolase